MAAGDEEYDDRKLGANWCWTLYLPQLPEIKHHPDIQYCVYQTEKCPRTGRIHLQGFLQLKNRKRRSTVKKIIGYNEVHVEPMRGTPQQASDYCEKQDSKLPGPSDKWGQMVKQGQRTDLLKVKAAIAEGKTFMDLTKDDELFSAVARCPTFVKEVIQLKEEEESLAELRAQHEDTELRPWQDECTAQCQEKPDTRSVVWICDEKGSAGKSFWASYMSAQENALVLSPDTFPNMAYLWRCADKKCRVVIIDCTRSTKDEASILSALQLAESLKNGNVQSTKYTPVIIRRPAPHVVFLSNYWPDTSRLSLDRWNLLCLKDGLLSMMQPSELPLTYRPR